MRKGRADARGGATRVAGVRLTSKGALSVKAEDVVKSSQVQRTIREMAKIGTTGKKKK